MQAGAGQQVTCRIGDQYAGSFNPIGQWPGRCQFGPGLQFITGVIARRNRQDRGPAQRADCFNISLLGASDSDSCTHITDLNRWSGIENTLEQEEKQNREYAAGW